jgi:hypothetical protein
VSILLSNSSKALSLIKVPAAIPIAAPTCPPREERLVFAFEPKFFTPDFTALALVEIQFFVVPEFP